MNKIFSVYNEDTKQRFSVMTESAERFFNILTEKGEDFAGFSPEQIHNIIEHNLVQTDVLD